MGPMGNKPLRVSWSQIRTHEECHRKSYLMRSGKKAKASNIRNFYHGMVVDRVMRDWLDSPLHQAGGMQQMVDAMMTTVADEAKEGDGLVRWRNPDDKADVRQFCLDLVSRLEPILRERVLPYRYEAGKWFKVPIQLPGPDGELRDVVLIGEMDLICYDDGPVIWDLKGTADDQYWRKVLGQLTFYDLAVTITSGQRTRLTGLIQPMCKEPVLEFVIDDGMRTDMLRRITAFAHDVWTDEASCKDSTSGCNYCEVRHACPRFGTQAAEAFGSLSDALRTAARGAS